MLDQFLLGHSSRDCDISCFFQNQFFVVVVVFSKKISVISVECQAVWIQIMPTRSDLGLNCLQRLSADDTSKERVYDDNSSKLES